MIPFHVPEMNRCFHWVFRVLVLIFLFTPILQAQPDVVERGNRPEVPVDHSAGEGDDTFAGLARPGPVLQIRGNQGYEQLTLMSWENDLKIDARGAHWSSHSWGMAGRHPTVNDTALNNYPIQLGADWVGAYPVRYSHYNYGRCAPPQKTRISLLRGNLLSKRIGICLLTGWPIDFAQGRTSRYG